VDSAQEEDFGEIGVEFFEGVVGEFWVWHVSVFIEIKGEWDDMAFVAAKPGAGLVEFGLGGCVNGGGAGEEFSAPCFEVEEFFWFALGHAPVIEHAVDAEDVGFAEFFADGGDLWV